MTVPIPQSCYVKSSRTGLEVNALGAFSSVFLSLFPTQLLHTQEAGLIAGTWNCGARCSCPEQTSVKNQITSSSKLTSQLPYFPSPTLHPPPKNKNKKEGKKLTSGPGQQRQLGLSRSGYVWNKVLKPALKLTSKRNLKFW